MDGTFSGKIARIPYRKRLKNFHVSYLEKDKKTHIELVVGYDSKKKELSFSEIKLKIVNEGVIPVGRYRLLIPKYRHSKSVRYLDETNGGTRFAETWFQIDLNNAVDQNCFFVHFGTISSGCITVIDSGKLWTKVYLTLMSNRVDNEAVAWLEVY